MRQREAHNKYRNHFFFTHLMLGSMFKAVVKGVTLPVDIAVDTLLALPEAAENDEIYSRTKRKVNSIADDLDDVV